MANTLKGGVLVIDTASATVVKIGAAKLDTTWYLRIRHMTWVYQANPGDQAIVNDGNGNLIYTFNDQMAGKTIAMSDIKAYNGLIVPTLAGGKLVIDLD